MIHLIALVAMLCAGTYKRTDYVTAYQFTKARKIVLKAHVRPNGTWYDAYTGRVVKIDDSLDIDHIIPLKYADGAGMSTRTTAEKRAFGVDTLNLVQTSQHENRSKGDKGPSEYMPRKGKCFYVARWDSVSVKYSIRVSSADSAVLAATRRYCR